MKLLHVQFVFVFLFISTVIHSQVDRQWYIYNGNSRIAGPAWSQGVPSSSFYINGEPHPNLQLEIPFTQNTRPGRNDFFVIYKNRNSNDKYDYINTRENGGIDTGEFSDTGNGYEITFSDQIEYMYLTNAYEEDYPPAAISNTSSGNPGIVLDFDNYRNYRSNNFISFNHNIVKNKDLTVIFDHSQIERNNCSNNLTLCFNSIDNVSTDIGGQFNVEITPGPVFDTGYMLNMTGDNEITQNCIHNISFDPDENYSFLNLSMPQEMGQLVGQNLQFNLIGESNSGCNEMETELILDTHDPNFIEVLCVAQEGANKCARFKIQCLNDSDQTVNHLKFHFDLAEGVVGNPIIKKKFIEPTSPNGSNVPEILNEKLTSKVDGFWVYDFGLGNALGQNRIAWIEFCVMLDANFVLESGLLNQQSAHTSFDGSQYPIINFIDPAIDQKDSLNMTVTDLPDMGTYPGQTRPVSPTCNCGSPIPWWSYLLGALLLFGLLFLVLRIRRP